MNSTPTPPGLTAAVRPIPDHPALVLEWGGGGSAERRLVVADLHLGLGGERAGVGLPPESGARAMAGEIVDLAHRERTTSVVIAGDAKHPIVGTPRTLRPVVFDFFSTLLSAGLGVELVLGNHDVGLPRHLPREVLVSAPTGVVHNGVGIFHGHAWPSRQVLRSRTLVVGHLHPGFRFAPTAERGAPKERCWVRVAIPLPPPRKLGARRAVHAAEIVVLPAFNPIAGVEALNRERPRRSRSFLVRRFLQRGEARAYLLDGTDLGRIFRSGASSRSATGRTRPKAR